MEAPSGFTHRSITVSDGVHLHCVCAGQNGGKRPLVILLHGFPEFWWSWRHQIRALAARGYHVVAPDLRGYAESDKPRRVDAYRIDRLAQDVADLVRAFGHERAFVAGHDWGGGIAWAFAMQHPEMLEGLAVLNSPHPAVLARSLWRPAQLRRSWYLLFFQLPRLPEALLRRNDFALLRASLRESMTGEEIERYVSAAKVPGALPSMLHYYRAMLRAAVRRKLPPVRRVETPVLVVWGERDRYLLPALARVPRALAADVRVERIAGASHWVQHDASDRVSELLLEFFAQRRRPARLKVVGTPS